jgi:hypothetical protein
MIFTTPLPYPHGVSETVLSHLKNLGTQTFVCALSSTSHSEPASARVSWNGVFVLVLHKLCGVLPPVLRAKKLQAEWCSHQTWQQPRNEGQEGRLSRSFHGALVRREVQDALMTAKKTKPCGLQAVREHRQPSVLDQASFNSHRSR